MLALLLIFFELISLATAFVFGIKILQYTCNALVLFLGNPCKCVKKDLKCKNYLMIYM